MSSAPSTSVNGCNRLNSLASTAVAAAASVPFDPAASKNNNAAVWENWSSTARMIPAYFHTPRTVEDISSILSFARSRGEKVRVVGFGHSPGNAALTSGHAVALGVHFNRVINIDREKKQATVESGISLEKLNAALDAVGLALPTLGSISDQTLGGTLACGTHGSNAKDDSTIATFVVHLELMDPQGKLWSCSANENTDLFNAARISLGALGVITNITVQCESAYDLIETSATIPFQDLVTPDKFDAMLYHNEADFVRFWWIPHTESVVYTRMKKIYDGEAQRDSVVKKKKQDGNALVKHIDMAKDVKDRFVGFHLLQALYYASTLGPRANEYLVPSIAQLYSKLVFPPLSNFQQAIASSSSSTTPAPSSPSSTIAAVGASLQNFFINRNQTWVRRDRHDRILNFDCLFKQYVTEWAIDQRHTVEALKRVRNYIESSNYVVHFPIEIRFGGKKERGDGVWLSASYEKPQTWIGIIMYRPYGKDVAFQEYFRGFERLLSDLSIGGSNSVKFEGKPHWAKNVVMPLSEIPFATLYPRWRDFLSLRRQMDPTNMFENEFVHALRRATKDEVSDKEEKQFAQVKTNLPAKL